MTINRLIRECLNLAEREVGVREVGSNRGPRVEEYLRSVGLPPSNPWCAAFVWFIVERATDLLQLTNPLPRTGYCPYLQSWADNAGYLRETPEPGDLFLLVGKTSAGTIRAHHTGFVAGVDGEQFDTIEGNTNLNGSPEGIGVFRRMRDAGPQYQFVRWADAVKQPAEKSYALNLNGHVSAVRLPVRADGQAWVGIRTFGSLLGRPVTWDNEAQGVRLNGTLLPVQIAVENGTAWAPIRDLVESLGGRVSFDPATKTVWVNVRV